MPATSGTAATASSPAARATVLLTPLAMPACRTSTAPSTVAVNGATVSASPRPSPMVPGRMSVRYEASGPIRASERTPRAATSGPTVMGIRGPIRCPSAPPRADRNSMMIVTGSSAAPDAIGENPATTCSATTSTKNTPDSAAYTANVTTLVAVKSRDRNTSSGSIGLADRASTRTNATRQATPPNREPQTTGEPKPRAGQAGDPPKRGAPDARRAEAPVGPGDEPVGQAGEAAGGEHRAGDVEPARH